MNLEASAGPLPHSACLDLLGAAGLGRIAISEGALPLILPVQYQMIEDQILFCCGSRLGQEREPIKQVVAFEAGGVNPAALEGWTVQVRGLARPHQQLPESSFEHCVQRRRGRSSVFSLLDAAEAFGYYYELCGDDRSP
jgi:hypothetical protein